GWDATRTSVSWTRLGVPPDSWLLQAKELLDGADVTAGPAAGLAVSPDAEDAGLAGVFPAVPGTLAEHAASSAGRIRTRAARLRVDISTSPFADPCHPWQLCHPAVRLTVVSIERRYGCAGYAGADMMISRGRPPILCWASHPDCQGRGRR